MAIQLENLLPLVTRIQADPANDASLRALAEQVGMSPTHLQRVFSREIGESPKRIALRIVLDRAATALVTTDDSILDIALASGFDSHDGFTRAFRRRTGATPTRYRQRGLTGGPPSDELLMTAHREVVERAAPCIGLYRVSLSRRETADTSARQRHTPQCHDRRTKMSYEISRKELTEAPILFARKRIEREQIADALAELLPMVYSYAVERGIPFAGPPLCRYREIGLGGTMTLEAGLPVAAPVEGGGEVHAGSLPGGPAASTVHSGAYDQLPEAHSAIEGWMADQGLDSGGDPWEVYLTDPGEVPDPADWRTEVVRPIAGPDA